MKVLIIFNIEVISYRSIVRAVTYIPLPSSNYNYNILLYHVWEKMETSKAKGFEEAACATGRLVKKKIGGNDQRCRDVVIIIDIARA